MPADGSNLASHFVIEACAFAIASNTVEQVKGLPGEGESWSVGRPALGGRWDRHISRVRRASCPHHNGWRYIILPTTRVSPCTIHRSLQTGHCAKTCRY